MQPFVVLGEYHPSKWNTWVIGPELVRFTRDKGLVPHPDPVHGPLHFVEWWSSDKHHAEVRKRTLTSPKAKRGEDWHQDGDLDPGSLMDCALVTWASTHPTEFKDPGGMVFQPRPYEVVVSRNLYGYHRRPHHSPVRRWLFRQRVQVPAHIQLP